MAESSYQHIRRIMSKNIATKKKKKHHEWDIFLKKFILKYKSVDKDIFKYKKLSDQEKRKQT